MKSRIHRWSVFALFIVVVMVIGSCDPGGGQGAEFDATQYYTRTEVDAIVTDAIQQAIDAVQPLGDASEGQALTDVDWTGRTLDGFAVPEGARYVLVEMTGTNDSGSAQTFYMVVCGNETDGQLVGQFTLPTGGSYNQYLGLAGIPEGTTRIYGWHNASGGYEFPATDLTDVEILVRPLLWFK